MADRLFLAGAAGAIGRALIPLLQADGWHVAGTTRTAERAAQLAALGIEPVVVDVFDAGALTRAVAAARPRVVVHQLTDLPPALDPARMADALVRNARIRDEGTRNLVAAAVAGGAQRLVAQSVAFAYAPGPQPWREGDPLNLTASGNAGVTVRGVASLESQILAAPMPGLVLRYGRFYGPGTGFDAPTGPGSIHVSAAAAATRRALTRGAPGLYNIAEDDGMVDVTRARVELGWSPVG